MSAIMSSHVDGNAWLTLYRDEYLTLQQIGDLEGVTREAIRLRVKKEGLEPRSTTETNKLRELKETSSRGDEIRQQFFQLRDVSATAGAVDLPAAWVQRYLELHLPDYAVLTRVPRSAAKRYAEAELVASLREAAESENGANLTAAAYARFVKRNPALADGRSRPGPQTMGLRYGSWRASLEAAGLPANPHGGPDKEFDESAAISAIVACWRDVGKPPTADSYDRWQRSVAGAPSTATVRKLLGPWNGLLARAWQVVHGITLDQDDEALGLPPDLRDETSTGDPFVEYRAANEMTEISLPSDLEMSRYSELERAVQSHSRIQNAVASHARDMGMRALSPSMTGPAFDVALERPDGSLILVEVKSATPQNIELQLRIGLGQVLRYAHQLRIAGARITPAIAIERGPDPVWRELLNDLGVTVLVEPSLAADFDALLSSPQEGDPRSDAIGSGAAADVQILP